MHKAGLRRKKSLPHNVTPEVVSDYKQMNYCKSGNICGTLIFANFAQIQQARIQKPAKIFAIICMHILDT